MRRHLSDDASAGQCYVEAFNARHRRSGTLFQGRFTSCLVESDRYRDRADGAAIGY